MQLQFFKSCLVMTNKSGPIYVCLHSGPSLGSKPARDEHSEVLASLCVEKFGGRAIIATVSRNRLYGVDFNREVPPLSKALEFYPIIKLGEDEEAISSYHKRFAWVAQDKKDYLKRLNLYNEFWEIVRRSGRFLVFVHSNRPRLKAAESIMDFATFENLGVRKDVLQKIVNDINEHNVDFLKRIRPKYHKAILYEQEIIVRRLQRTFHSLRPWKMRGLFRENYEQDLEMAKKYGVRPMSWTRQGIYELTRKTLNLCQLPKVTVESMFTTMSSYAPKKLLGKNKVVIQLEVNQFVCKSYANQTTDMLMDILRAVRDAQKSKQR